MKVKIFIPLLMGIMLFSSAAWSRDELVIENVSLNPKVLELGTSSKANINFLLSRKAEVQLVIYNEINQEIYHSKKTTLPAGTHSFTWDGAADTGEKVPNGAYTYLVESKDQDASFTYNPASRTAGLDLEPVKYKINRLNKEVKYILPKAAWLKMRVGIKDGPLFNTPIDWQAKPAGENIFKLTVIPHPGNFDIAKYPDLNIYFQAISLPANSIIVSGGKIKDKSIYLTEIKKGTIKLNYPVLLRTEIFIPEPEFEIEITEQVSKNKEGIIQVSNTLPVRIILDPRDKERLTNTRFEIMVFIDNIFVYEDEQAYSPFNYCWDLSGVPEGLHTLTVNIVGYDKTVGTKNLEIYVKNKQE